uniref:Uncharacterized protein n=1 Tax=Rhizophora mucronata TaxID=61149 RepID=A0A2P2J673_RHIMU
MLMFSVPCNKTMDFSLGFNQAPASKFISVSLRHQFANSSYIFPFTRLGINVG